MSVNNESSFLKRGKGWNVLLLGIICGKRLEMSGLGYGVWTARVHIDSGLVRGVRDDRATENDREYGLSPKWNECVGEARLA